MRWIQFTLSFSTQGAQQHTRYNPQLHKFLQVLSGQSTSSVAHQSVTRWENTFVSFIYCLQLHKHHCKYNDNCYIILASQHTTSNRFNHASLKENQDEWRCPLMWDHKELVSLVFWGDTQVFHNGTKVMLPCSPKMLFTSLAHQLFLDIMLQIFQLHNGPLSMQSAVADLGFAEWTPIVGFDLHANSGRTVLCRTNKNEWGGGNPRNPLSLDLSLE